MVQAGFRELQRKMKPEDEQVDLDDDSDFETASPKLSQATPVRTGTTSSSQPRLLTPPDNTEPPSLPPQKQRKLSRALSATLALSGVDPQDLAKPNPWTSVAPNFKPSASTPNLQFLGMPTRESGMKKRDRSADSPNKTAKKGRRYVE